MPFRYKYNKSDEKNLIYKAHYTSHKILFANTDIASIYREMRDIICKHEMNCRKFVEKCFNTFHQDLLCLDNIKCCIKIKAKLSEEQEEYVDNLNDRITKQLEGSISAISEDEKMQLNIILNCNRETAIDDILMCFEEDLKDYNYNKDDESIFNMITDISHAILLEDFDIVNQYRIMRNNLCNDNEECKMAVEKCFHSFYKDLFCRNNRSLSSSAWKKFNKSQQKYFKELYNVIAIKLAVEE
ncbi:uncharacterized protein LOC126902655 isoform X2 [Daktulosphaira vitifoliae]|uniref:uncharacterized protein LOC126902655 isoform X2 n=1 Tax=Daktulosphaira vitifoliae TaxID=58002 RepID=UPI0021AAA6AB|nr:uncharacterized protein LOC126902655 isoform X2 [Daktulosphaira vitifoliae]